MLCSHQTRSKFFHAACLHKKSIWVFPQQATQISHYSHIQANIKYSTTVKNLRMQSVVLGKPGTAEWQSYCLAAEGVNRRVGPSWRINTRSHIWFCSDLKKFTSRRKAQGLLFKLLGLKKNVSSHSLLNLLQQRVKEVATRPPLSGIYVL